MALNSDVLPRTEPFKYTSPVRDTLQGGRGNVQPVTGGFQEKNKKTIPIRWTQELTRSPDSENIAYESQDEIITTVNNPPDLK